MNKYNEVGILFLALCKSDYVYLARNCAVSLRNCGYEGKITLLTDDATLARPRNEPAWMKVLDFFDEIIVHNGLPKTRDKMGLAKLLLYQLSPYKETLFIDGDMLCPKNFSFDKAYEFLKNRDFHSRIDGFQDSYSLNQTVANIVGTKKQHIYFTHTAVIWFKKGKVAESIFSDAINVWEKITAMGKQVNPNAFYGGVTDEVCFSGGLAFKYEFEPLDYKGFCNVYHTHNAIDDYNNKDVICSWGSGPNSLGANLLNSYNVFYKQVKRDIEAKGILAPDVYSISEKMKMS